MPTLPPLFGGRAAAERRDAAKAALLAAVAPLARGAAATDAQKADVASKFAALEKLNPTRAPLAAPELNGRWKLLYTTSAGILGTARPPPFRPFGPIYQLLDGPNMKAQNREVRKRERSREGERSRERKSVREPTSSSSLSSLRPSPFSTGSTPRSPPNPLPAWASSF